MRDARFSLRHNGCWSSEAYDKFPEVTGTLLANAFSGTKKLHWSFIWSFKAKDETQLHSFLNFFTKHRTIKESEVLFQKSNAAIVHEKSIPESSAVTNTIYKNNCYVMWDMSVDHGFERWHVLTEKPQHLKALFSDLNQLGDLIIEKIGRYETKKTSFNMTQKQLAAVKLALGNGYYSWPRKITLEELAAISGVTRRTYQDHLRKAEGKILHNTIENLAEF